MVLNLISGYSVMTMERVLIAIASAVITGAIFLGASSLTQIVAPVLAWLANHSLLGPILSAVFFGMLTFLSAVLANIRRHRRLMDAALLAIVSGGASYLGSVSGRFIFPLVVKHPNLVPVVAAIYIGILAIFGAVSFIIFRRIAMHTRPMQ